MQQWKKSCLDLKGYRTWRDFIYFNYSYIFVYFTGFKLPVRPRSRDYKQRNYSPEALERAVEAVKSGLLTANRAAVLYGVPQRTVYNRIGKYKMSVNQNNDYVSHILQKVIFDDK